MSAQKSIHWAGYKWFLRDDQNSGPGKYSFLFMLSAI